MQPKFVAMCSKMKIASGPFTLAAVTSLQSYVESVRFHPKSDAQSRKSQSKVQRTVTVTEINVALILGSDVDFRSQDRY